MLSLPPNSVSRAGRGRSTPASCAHPAPHPLGAQEPREGSAAPCPQGDRNCGEGPERGKALLGHALGLGAAGGARDPGEARAPPGSLRQQGRRARVCKAPKPELARAAMPPARGRHDSVRPAQTAVADGISSPRSARQGRQRAANPSVNPRSPAARQGLKPRHNPPPGATARPGQPGPQCRDLPAGQNRGCSWAPGAAARPLWAAPAGSARARPLLPHTGPLLRTPTPERPLVWPRL